MELLADHPDAVRVLVEWFEREWAPYYGAEGPGDARADLVESSRRAGLPIALVALSDVGVAGTAVLKKESVTTHRHLSPWLAALLVAPEHRGRGVARTLVAAIESLARDLGFDAIYAGAGEADPGTSGSLLAARGWDLVDRGPYFASEVSVYRKVL